MRVPSIAERMSAAIELGIIEPGESLTPRLQVKLAQAIQLTEQAGAVDEEDSSADPVPLIANIYARLIDAGLPIPAAAQVTAALALDIWRANTGAAHA